MLFLRPSRSIGQSQSQLPSPRMNRGSTQWSTWEINLGNRREEDVWMNIPWAKSLRKVQTVIRLTSPEVVEIETSTMMDPDVGYRSVISTDGNLAVTTDPSRSISSPHRGVHFCGFPWIESALTECRISVTFQWVSGLSLTGWLWHPMLCASHYSVKFLKWNRQLWHRKTLVKPRQRVSHNSRMTNELIDLRHSESKSAQL